MLLAVDTSFMSPLVAIDTKRRIVVWAHRGILSSEFIVVVATRVTPLLAALPGTKRGVSLSRGLVGAFSPRMLLLCPRTHSDNEVDII